jgi:hypothetical protein
MNDESQRTLTGAVMWDISLPATTQNIAVSLPADFGEKYSSNERLQHSAPKIDYLHHVEQSIQFPFQHL